MRLDADVREGVGMMMAVVVVVVWRGRGFGEGGGLKRADLAVQETSP